MAPVFESFKMGKKDNVKGSRKPSKTDSKKLKRKRSRKTSYTTSRPSRTIETTHREEDNEADFPLRNLDRLYVCQATVDCAMGTAEKNGIQAKFHNVCIPCAYKCANFDVALDTVFCRRCPNQRPEQCPREKARKSDHLGHGTSQSIPTAFSVGFFQSVKNARHLTVGDGDFSFSLALARMLANGVVSDGDRRKSPIIATSLESQAMLELFYPNLEHTLHELRNKFGVLVLFEVDATRLEETLLPQLKSAPSVPTFDYIHWNFPCTNVEAGQDGQNIAMETNKALVGSFVKQLSGTRTKTQWLTPCTGQVHMMHKTKPPFNQWRLEDLVLAATNTDSDGDEYNIDKSNWSYYGRVVLDRCLFPPYFPRKAKDRRSFPCHDACVYIFGPCLEYAGSKTIDSRESSPLDSLSQLVPVTPELVARVRSRVLAATSSLQTSQKHPKHQHSPGKKVRRKKR